MGKGILPKTPDMANLHSLPMMNYIVCEKPGELKLKQKEVPTPSPHEALLQIKNIGICGTDLHAYTGNQAYFTYPRILGHELAAQILEIEDHPTLKAGDKVVVMPYMSCGTCIACRQGKTNCCQHLEVLGVHTDGGMQEIITVSHDFLIPAPQLSYQEMAIVEPLSIGAHAIRRSDLQVGEFIAVMGAGPIGLGIMALAQMMGATVIAMDINDQRLQFAQEVIGVDHTINVASNPLAKVQEITDHDLATAVFDATGNRQALEAGPQFMAHGGRYILVGLSKDQLSFNHPSIHAKEATLMCSRNATREDFQFVIKVLERQAFPTEAFITHMVPFGQMITQFEEWLKPESGVIKAMIEL